MKAIIMAGGGGTRLFPLSRKCMPKQFLGIDRKSSLLEETIRRCRSFAKEEDILIVTNEEYRQYVEKELVSAELKGANLVLEPLARNTAPAVTLAAKYAQEKLGADYEEVLFVSTSDHVIRPVETFKAAVGLAVKVAEKGKFVTFGVRPSYPETGFGYIELGGESGGAYKTVSFKEKPDICSAKYYLKQGNYLWNSGMFAFRLGDFFVELSKHAPNIYALTQGTYEDMTAVFEKMPNISIDYAVAEHTENGVTLPLPCYWNDVGSWDAIYDLLEKDSEGNALKGDVVSIDSKKNLIYGKKRLIATVGLEDTIVVETGDVILVAGRGHSQKVKELVTVLKARGRREVEIFTEETHGK